MNFSIKDNIAAVRERINAAERRSGRPENSVRLMAVSKFHPAEAVIEAAAAGQLLFGENRVQEAAGKFPEIMERFPGMELHMIGNLQANKVRHIVGLASCIESVDRIPLLQEIERRCAKSDLNMRILFEFRTGEDSKSGFVSEEDMERAAAFCAEGNCPHIVPSGFMTMAPLTSDTGTVRAAFRKMRRAAERIRAEFPMLALDELSMGMSGDFETAVEEGSTMVRVGTAIFGERRI